MNGLNNQHRDKSNANMIAQERFVFFDDEDDYNKGKEKKKELNNCHCQKTFGEFSGFKTFPKKKKYKYATYHPRNGKNT